MVKYIIFYFSYIVYDLLIWARKQGCDTCSLTFLVFTEHPQNGYNDINGQNFSTYDRDQDQMAGRNCAQYVHGAWWYNYCSYSNPNGRYFTPGTDDGRSMIYVAFRYNGESLRTMKLMFR